MQQIVRCGRDQFPRAAISELGTLQIKSIRRRRYYT